jgi:hydroxymethylpyrimidine pyrophosphatase-like HAD family hydrolase
VSGWIKLHRGIFDHWIASDPDYLCVWLRMLTDANFEDKKHLFNGSLIEIKRGQIIFGLEAWSTKTGVTIAKLRRLIDMLEKDKMINRQKTNKFSLISILNYTRYQDDDRQNASKSQAEDKQNATPKELKNIRIKEVNTLVDSDESPALVSKKKKPSAFDDMKVTYQERAFNVFWSEVEKKKVGKADALKAFLELTKNCDEETTDYALNVICHWYDLYLQEDESRLLPENKKYLKGAGAWMREKPWQADKEALAKFKAEYYGEQQ